MYSTTKAARFWQLAFSAILLGFVVSCEDPGSVGATFVDESEVKVDTILLSGMPLTSVDPYMGKLSSSPVGKFSDPMFGDIETITFFKPDVDRLSTDTLFADDVLRLKLKVNTAYVYGDTLSEGTYNIYRVTSSWRGTTYKLSDDISTGAELIGSFSDADVDTNGFVRADLGGSWRTTYQQYFEMEDDSARDADYRANDFGLAIVPDPSNTKILYTTMASSSIEIAGEDTTVYTMLDWGHDVTRTNIPVNGSEITLQSTYENVLQLDITDAVRSSNLKNIVRAELVFSEDTLAMQNSLGDNEVRSRVSSLGLTQGEIEDKAYEFGFSDNQIVGYFLSGKFRFNVTGIVNASLYADEPLNNIFVYGNTPSGVLGFTSIYSTSTTDPDKAPRLVIYGIE